MLSREELQRMKRTDLQRLSKTYGIRANLKNEELVELLIAESERAKHSVPTSTIAVNDLTVPTRIPSRTRSRLQSNNTVVQHDDTDVTEDEVLTPATLIETEAAPTPASTTGPASRTRKAKDTQLRLGVGRPAVAGGEGARAVIKSVSRTKSKRIKPSRDGKPVEDAIAEESPEAVETAPSPIPGPSQLPGIRAQTTEISILALPENARGQIRQVVDEQVQPLLVTVASLRQELDESAALHRKDVDALQKRINELTSEIQNFRRQTQSIEALRTTVEQLLQNAPPSTRKSVEPFPSEFLLEPAKPKSSSRSSQPPTVDSQSNFKPPVNFEFPPPPSTKKQSKETGYYALGKRRRPVSDEEALMTPIAGPSRTAGTDDVCGGFAVPQPRKRQRMDSSNSTPHAPTPLPSGIHDDVDSLATPAASAFNVYTGPEELNTADFLNEQFTDQDFDFFAASQAPVPTHGSGPLTSTAHDLENQRHPFLFGTGEMTTGAIATPHTHAPVPPPESDESPAVNNLLFPPVPHSPTPAPSSRVGRAGSTQPVMTPVDVTATPREEPTTPPATFGNAPMFPYGANGMEYTAIAAALQQQTPPARTMYGTEVDGDQRFGDFGYDWSTFSR